MKRRNFLATLAALPFAAKPLEALSEQAPALFAPREFAVPITIGSGAYSGAAQVAMSNEMTRIWRKCQSKVRDGFDTLEWEWDQIEEIPTEEVTLDG